MEQFTALDENHYIITDMRDELEVSSVLSIIYDQDRPLLTVPVSRASPAAYFFKIFFLNFSTQCPNNFMWQSYYNLYLFNNPLRTCWQ